jgi:hypothetical protein
MMDIEQNFLVWAQATEAWDYHEFGQTFCRGVVPQLRTTE